MVNVSGSIILNGVTDKELGKIWEFKAKAENKFVFNPQQMQLSNQGTPIYNNVVFSWPNEVGLQIVHEILTYLLKKEEKAEAAAQ